MKFTEMLVSEDTIQESEKWAKQDLINLIEEQEIDDEEIIEITEAVLEYVESINEIALDEKMSSQAKIKANKYRMKPSFKKADRLKKQCMEKNKDRIASSDGKLTCNTKGKVVKGMPKAKKKALLKARKKNASRIVD